VTDPLARGPLYVVTQRFGPADGDCWDRYVEWAGLPQLTELVTVDGSLCERVIDAPAPEDWPHVVQANFMLGFFTDLEHLLRRVGSVANRNVLCVFREPERHPEPPHPAHWRFEGYDLLDRTVGPSALSNCGGFPLAFHNRELSPNGLLPSLDRAREVQRALLHCYPDEQHADCHVWAVFRAVGAMWASPRATA
jgi:hypothetical protein